MAQSTARWNLFPVAIDDSPWRLWDWRYPQFLVGLIPQPLPAIFPALGNRRVAFGREGGRAFEWKGWSGSDAESCWTERHRARLIFAADDLSSDRLRLCFGPYLHGHKIHKQRITILLNGQTLTEFTAHDPAPREYVFGLLPGTLQRRNVLTFELPDAASPASVGESEDGRALGIALRWLELKGKPAAGSPEPASQTR